MNRIRKKQIKRIIWQGAEKIPYLKELYKSVKRMSGYKGDKDYEKIMKSYVWIGEDLSLNGAAKVILDWPEGIEKPYVGLVKDDGEMCYWPKYERFLKNNHIRYDFYDVHRSDFISRAEDFDIIVWKTACNPAEQEEAASKIWVLQNIMKKICVPSYEELWFYENKENQYYLCKINGLPVINTFVTHSKEEALAYIKSCRYPLVSKITNGSGSQGVKLVKSLRAAERICRKAFGSGLKTMWTYVRQKDYIYFQDYISGAEFDLRIITVGESCFGYYRRPAKGDFRASGAGNEDICTPIPEEALLLARKVKTCFPRTRVLAVDLLMNPEDGKYYVIETSIFYRIDIPSEMVVEGRLGRFVYEDGKFRFEAGRFWVQELALAEVMKEWMKLKGA